MPDLQPVSGSANTVNTTNGTVYYYTGMNAAAAVAASMTQIQLAETANADAQAQAMLANIKGGDELVVVLGGILASIATGVVGAAGTAGAAAVGAATVGSFATNVANTALAYSQAKGQDPLASAEIIVRNNMIGPLVCGDFSGSGCSTASALSPILPGASTGIDLLQPNGFDDGAHLKMTFNAGATGYGNPANGDYTEAVPTECSVQMTYDGDWTPTITIDGSQSFNNTSSNLTAVSFVPNEGSLHSGLTIASMLVNKSTGAMAVSFLPASMNYVS
ncbi:MAG: hypothetical protein ROO70_03550 [Labrenzia sp.]